MLALAERHSERRKRGQASRAWEEARIGGVTCLHGGPVFDGARWYDDGTVLFDEKEILDVLPAMVRVQGASNLDVGGHLIMPGLVDLHSDALEKCIEMRPGVHFDHEFSLQNLDTRLALCGITSYCHGISFAGSEWGLRACDQAEQLARLVQRFSRSSKAMVRHFVHARYEITSETGIEHLERLMTEGLIDILSIMDHTPGQGQFRTMESYIAYKTGTYDVTRDEALRMAELKLLEREKGFPRVERLVKRAAQHGIPLLSHDDDTPEKIRLLSGLGVQGCEFPLTMDAVSEARRCGMKVFMGAPNLMRDQSSNNHLKASETLLNHVCDGLMSDYYPESLVQTPFLAHHRHGLDLEDTLNLVTHNPGLFLQPLSGLGSLRPGAPSDIVVLSRTTPWVRVLGTWVSGRRVLSLPSHNLHTNDIRPAI